MPIGERRISNDVHRARAHHPIPSSSPSITSVGVARAPTVQAFSRSDGTVRLAGTRVAGPFTHAPAANAEALETASTIRPLRAVS